MQAIQPFILPGVFLFWMVAGAQSWLAWRANRRRLSEVDQTDPPESTEKSPKPKKVVSGYGVVWFFIGLAGLLSYRPQVGLNSHSFTEAPGSDPELAGVIHEVCDDFAGAWTRASLNVAVVADDRVAIVSYGRASINGSPANTNTIYELGSISKAFTGITMADAVERGLLRTNQAIVELLPEEEKLSAAGGDQLELWHLATHTAGLPRLPGGSFSPLALLEVLFNGDPYRSYSEEKLHADLADLEVSGKPGTEMNYSNFGAGIAAYLVSRAQGQSFSVSVQKSVLDPLGMSNTSIELEGEAKERFAQGYAAIVSCGPMAMGMRSSAWTFSDFMAGAGGLRSDITDMLKFLRANMDPDSTSIAGRLRLAQQELFKRGEAGGVGMFWMIRRVGEREIIWHNGGTGGFHTYMGFTRDGRHGVVLLNNSKRPPDHLGYEILIKLAGQKK